MPDFPRYNSRGQLTAQQPSVLSAPDNAGKELEVISQAAGQLGDAAMKWANAVDTIQKTRATANFKAGMADIEARAAADPDYNNSEQYIQEIERLRNENTGGFATRATETEMNLNLGLEAQVGRIKIENIYKKKMIDVGQASTLELIDAEVSDPSPSSLENIKALLNEQVQAGVYSRKDAFKLLQKAESDIKQNNFILDMEQDTELAEEKLKKNEYEFNVDVLSKARTMLDNKKAKNEEDRKQAMLDATNEAAQQLIDKTLTPEKLDNLVSNGLMTPNMALSFKLATAGPKVWKSFLSLEEQGAKSKIMTDNLEKVAENDIESRTQIVEAALRDYHTGKSGVKLDDNDLTFILRAANTKAENPSNPIWESLKGVMKFLRATKKDDVRYGAMEKFRDRWDMEQDPSPVMMEALQETYYGADERARKYVVGEMYPQGKFLGFDPTDGSLIFEN